ncbi:DUF4352 domain-containing protein [Bacillus piscicola]|uniref:DUF4352 domain-containing protein n=1 Tax=Bacillus piscicola TaxID=1632684 RepID=UPI001F08C087|nr:DUF4352 domain-containing protein [Bacillus piscicola]
MDKRYWLLLGLTLLLGIFSGMFIQSQRTVVQTDQFTQTVSADTEHVLEVGGTETIQGFDITVHEAYISEEEDSRYVVVDLSFRNNTEEPKEIPLFSTLVVDSDGHASEYVSSYGDQRLIGGQLRAGGLRRGTLAYKVEPSSYYEFTFTNHKGKGVATWNLNLSDEKSS